MQFNQSISQVSQGENKIEQEYKMQMQKMKSQKEVDDIDFEDEESWINFNVSIISFYN